MENDNVVCLVRKKKGGKGIYGRKNSGIRQFFSPTLVRKLKSTHGLFESYIHLVLYSNVMNIFQYEFGCPF